MPRYQVRLLITFLILIIGADTVMAQRRSTRRVSAQQPMNSQSGVSHDVSPDKGSDLYWAAQRSIEAAIQQLEKYLRESPDGDHAATARQQLQVLREMSNAALRTEWVMMDSLPLSYVPQWRIASVDRRPEMTRIVIEVNCRRDDGGDCYFNPFDRFPLVLVDNAGRFYKMLESSPSPTSVNLRNDGQASFSGGRVISFIIDFAPLARGTAAGQLYYRDRNRAQPARFSLFRQQ